MTLHQKEEDSEQNIIIEIIKTPTASIRRVLMPLHPD
jgi:hypothetical protein